MILALALVIVALQAIGNMKLFGRSGGYYLFWSSAVYLFVGLYCALYLKSVPTSLIQIIWLAVLALPFTYPPLGRYFNLDIKWDKKMFDWFGKKNKESSNVVPFPNKAESVPYVEPPKEPEKPAVTYYRLGITDNGRVSFQMGYSEITMNAGGIDNMIKQLQVFRDQIREYEEHGDDA